MTELPFSDEQFLRKAYEALLVPRLIEEKMLLLLRQGRVSKWFSGIGQEAISVGATLAMARDEYILPLHRNLGVFTTRGVPLKRLVAQWQGKVDGFTKGRDRSFHFGTNEHSIVGMISHLGPQLCVADGIALASRLKRESKATLTFTGEGGTSEGDFHEALNVASVWDLPVIFLIENNGYALSTPTSEQFRAARLADRAIGYGMEGIQIDGNDLVEVYSTVHKAAQEIRRKPRPILIECITFRMRGHEEASGTKYVPAELLEQWAARDPIATFERQLFERGLFTKATAAALREKLKIALSKEIETALEGEEPQPSPERELFDVYAPPSRETESDTDEMAGPETRFVDAISDALKVAMDHDERLVLMGQDIAEYGGVFKITDGLVAKFGSERVRNTPLCESAICGAALGLAVKGIPSVVEMQFADFVSCGFNQIVNNFAKSHYRWGQEVPVVVRMPTGAGSGAGPFHSQSNEAWFTHTPGLKVVYPSTPFDAKGLLLSAIADPNPVMFFEHKGLYRSVSGPVPQGYYRVPIGKGAHVVRGDRLTIVTYGMGVRWASALAKEFPDGEIGVIDLRTLLPLDWDIIAEAVQASHRVVVLHEDTLFGGIGGEIAAWIGEHLFAELDAPVARVGSLDTPVPFHPQLEASFLPLVRLREAVKKTLSF